MRRLQPSFIRLFILIALCLSIAGAGWGAISSPADIKDFQNKLIKANLDYRYSFFFSIGAGQSDDDPTFGNSDHQCTIGGGFDDMRSISKLGEVKASLARFLDENERNVFKMRVFSSIIGALVPLILALPLTAGLFVSFNLTLWLLSRLTQSRLAALAVVAFDVLLALVMPTIVSGVLLTILVFAIVFSFDTLPDYSMFQNPTWITLTISSASVLLGFYLSTPVVVALFTKEFPFEFIGPSYIVSTIAGYAYDNAKSLFVDIGRIVKFDFDIGPAETLINYAIGIDLLFSLVYIVPCLLLVLMQRSDLTRKILLNIMQWVAEHPKGPLIALEEIVTSFAKYLIGIVKR
jgi:hypothetical protein